MNHKRLIISIKEGDLISFEKLYFLYNIKLFNFSFKLLKSKEDAEEIVQDTFVKIWEKRPSLDENLSIQAFIFKISKNLILNKIRKKVNEPLKYEKINENSVIIYNTEDEIIYQDLKSFAEIAINKLPPQRQRIYNLSRVDGLTYQEIADKLAISPRTVEVHLRKGLKSIKEFLDIYMTIT